MFTGYVIIGKYTRQGYLLFYPGLEVLTSPMLSKAMLSGGFGTHAVLYVTTSFITDIYANSGISKEKNRFLW